MLKIRTEFTNLYIKNPPAKSPPDIPSTVKNPSDSFGTEKRKPGLAGPGDAIAEAAIEDDVVTSTLSYPVFTDNANNLLAAELGMGYHTNGFIKVPRSLLADPRFYGAHALYRIVFLKILELVCWAPTEFNDNRVMINLEPGQVCMSIRELTKQCGKGVSKNWVTGAIKYFCSCSKLRQEVRHTKTILTVINIDTYDLKKSIGQTASQTKVRQNSDTKEEDQDFKKEEKNKKRSRRTSAPVDNAEALRLCSLFLKTLEKTLPELKPPQDLEPWRHEFERMLRIDGRKPEDIEFILLKLSGHWYAPNVQSAGTFRKKYAQISAYINQKTPDTNVEANRNMIREVKKDPRYSERLKFWSLSGDWVVNSKNSKELSLKMSPDEFKRAFQDLARSS
jgi:hypothetical protein